MAVTIQFCLSLIPSSSFLLPLLLLFLLPSLSLSLSLQLVFSIEFPFLHLPLSFLFNFVPPPFSFSLSLSFSPLVFSHFSPTMEGKLLGHLSVILPSPSYPPGFLDVAFLLSVIIAWAWS